MLLMKAKVQRRSRTNNISSYIIGMSHLYPAGNAERSYCAGHWSLWGAPRVTIHLGLLLFILLFGHCHSMQKIIFWIWHLRLNNDIFLFDLLSMFVSVYNSEEPEYRLLVKVPGHYIQFRPIKINWIFLCALCCKNYLSYLYVLLLQEHHYGNVNDHARAKNVERFIGFIEYQKAHEKKDLFLWHQNITAHDNSWTKL